MGSNTETYTKTFSIDLERANYHLKCRKRRKKRIIVIVVIWALFFAYLFSPLSKINLRVEGNVYYTKEELMTMANLKKNNHWWLVDTKKADKVLESYAFIDSVSITKSILGVKININEIYPIAIKDDKLVMNNKTYIERSEYELNEKITTLASFDDVGDSDIDYLINKYRDVSLDVRNHFTKVEVVRYSSEYAYVNLYGYDSNIGYFVIQTDLVFLNTKFNENKYNEIIEEISKNNVKYEEDEPALIAYNYLDEKEFHLVVSFGEE